VRPLDKVGAPLFYREVNLRFVDAVRDLSSIRWRFGTVSSAAPPPVVLENLSVCGDCHSFSADGAVLGMDIDYANDDVSYARAAWECFKSNDLEGTERHARKALELNPKNGEALHNLGLAFFGRKQYGDLHSPQ
jgi:tetratricopeptide (TPR) repeat protein